MQRFKNNLVIKSDYLKKCYLDNYIKAGEMVEYLKPYFKNDNAKCLKDFGITSAGFKLVGNELKMYYNM